MIEFTIAILPLTFLTYSEGVLYRWVLNIKQIHTDPRVLWTRVSLQKQCSLIISCVIQNKYGLDWDQWFTDQYVDQRKNSREQVWLLHFSRRDDKWRCCKISYSRFENRNVCRQTHTFLEIKQIVVGGLCWITCFLPPLLWSVILVHDAGNRKHEHRSKYIK